MRTSVFRHALFLAVALTSLTGCSLGHRRPETWVSVQSQHFVVVGNTGTRRARIVAEQFEGMRRVFQTAFRNARVDGGRPTVILAVADEAALEQLLPAYWEQEGGKHPAGVFVPGLDRNSIALRVDVGGENPYRVIYHEYVHALVQLNLSVIPLWLNEGLAELYSNTTIDGKDAKVGRPIPRYTAYLRKRRWIPPVEFFKVDMDSPHYVESSSAPLFYAQSWALAHYLLLGEKGEHRSMLYDYLDYLERGSDEMEAAEEAFGDLHALFEILHDYVSQNQFYYLPVPLQSEPSPENLESRDLTDAEALAAQGDFLVRTHRPVEARALLSEALSLDPTLGDARQSMALLEIQLGKLEQARLQLRQALELDPESFSAHYYAGVLSAQGTPTADDLTRAEEHLRRSANLNPDFAPARSALASVYALQGIQLQEAWHLARQAVSLEPGVSSHRLALAIVLYRLGKVTEALSAAQRAATLARSEEERARARALIQSLEVRRPAVKTGETRR